MNRKQQKILITGGNGFIGSHVAKRLHDRGDYVRVIDLSSKPDFRLYPNTRDFCTEFITGDLRNLTVCRRAMKGMQWVFNFAANMGGMGTIHEENNFHIYRDNHIITLNVLQAAVEAKIERLFYASSACVYPDKKQQNNADINLKLKESDVWSDLPDPQELYGLEKLNGEILVSHCVNNKSPIQIRIGRFHNVFGEGGAWFGGREKAPAALLRKAICAKYIGSAEMEVWGSGKQRRSFLYIDDCVDAIVKVMESERSHAFNIGSEESVTIEELAYIAFDTLGIPCEKITLLRDNNTPVGVQNRNSDNRLIYETLGWSPRYSIREGMKRTCDWIQSEINAQKKGCSNDEIWMQHLKNYQRSEIKILSKDYIKFGILLPITSRGLERPEDCLENLGQFAKSLYETTQADVHGFNEERFSIQVYIGIDQDDRLFHPIKNNPAERIMIDHGFLDVETYEFDFPPGSVCQIWRALAKKAYNRQCDYMVLLGDDIELCTTNWMSKIHKAFIALASEKNVPCGFGCVTFNDLSFPGFPSFPVMGKIHFDIFDGVMFPSIFRNQDADPFLFQLYRRWGCSVLLQDVKLRNMIGGSVRTRYEKEHCKNWSFDTLDNAILQVEQWIEKTTKKQIPRLLTLDVIVPSYRVLLEYLEPIIRLKSSDTTSTTFIIIIDNPTSNNISILRDRYEHDPFVRIRVNEKNLGASATRNRGLQESSADYVLLLDDDVRPDSNILKESEQIIRKFPNACGFIGSTSFPDPAANICFSAVRMAGITYFWDVADKINEDVPWGVTANLLVRRCDDNVWFDQRFPKTGGGEDIDYCLRKKKFFQNIPNGEGFRAAPLVKAVHPWWNNGKRSYSRFAAWAQGDGELIYMYPEHTFQDVAPNSAEILVGSVLTFCLILPAALVTSQHTLIRLAVVNFFAIPLVIVANMFVDIYRHTIESPNDYVPNLRGPRRFFAAAESSIIRFYSESGRLIGLLKKRRWDCLGKRFDWFTRRFGDITRNVERRQTGIRFLVWIILVLFITMYVFHF